MSNVEPTQPAAPVDFIPNEFGPDTRDSYHVLKDGHLFAVFDETGDMNRRGSGPGEARSKDGLFLADTRMLSRFVLTLNGSEPTPLGARTSESAAQFRSALANQRLIDDRGEVFPAYQIHIARNRALSGGLHERIRICNYSSRPAQLDVCFDCWSDFRDIFEVRGVIPTVRGRARPPETRADGFEFGYDTADGRVLSTRVAFDRPTRMHGSRAHIALRVEAGGAEDIHCTVLATQGERFDEVEASAAAYERAQATSHDRVSTHVARLDLIATSRPTFDIWLKRSAADLAMLTVDLGAGPFPHAGVPWFSAPFGRDALITAMEVLWLDPALAAGVLDFLADRQAVEANPFHESQPGKILHEERYGEMSQTGQVPFGRYYGGIDQTLLFVILAGAYYRRTADLGTVRRLEPNIRAALDWARNFGDRDGDGFIEYQRESENGLRNQGWKDSDDALFHADGRLCEGPIALIEVQAYHVAALRAGADMLDAIGDDGAPLRATADDLVERIDAAFWDDDLGGYCIALDGAKKPVRVLSSNAGHVLFAGAARAERAEVLAATLSGGKLMSPFGITTVARDASRFNPMGYHTGSVWPHDNAIIAQGLAAYGFSTEAALISTRLFEAAMHFPHNRLPELWCGIAGGLDVPVAYPSACSPQAWSAAASYLCIQACLGLRIDAVTREVHVQRPCLPAGLSELSVRNLRVCDDEVTLRFVQRGERAQMEIERAPASLRFSFDI